MELVRTQSRDNFVVEGGDSISERLAQLPSELLKLEIVQQLQDKSSLDRQRKSLILQSTDFCACDATLTGGKGSSLAILSCIRGVAVPNFFLATIHAFEAHFNSEAKCQAGLVKLEEASAKVAQEESFANLSEICKVAEELRDLIIKTPLVPHVGDAIAEAYKNLCLNLLGAPGANNNNNNNVPVAVRSSATTEDSANASTAGQHDSFLNVCGTEDVLEAVRACWASCFTERSCIYRVRCGTPQRAAIMSVVVQQMVKDITVAGTSFSINIADGYEGPHVAATYGLGESVVSGSVFADSFQFGTKSNNTASTSSPRGASDDELVLIRSDLGTKMTEIVPDPAKKSGTIEREVDRARREKYCMSDAQALLVAQSTVAIQHVYRECFSYDHVDTEFAVDSKGDVLLLQSRPVVQLERKTVKTVDRHDVGPHNKVVSGAYGLPGAVVGTAKVVFSFDDVASGKVKLDAGSILITPKTSNYVEKWIADVAGIITVDGSPSAHPMLIGRERGLPVICGVADLMERAKHLHGKLVTMDGLTKYLYSGDVRLKDADEKEIAAQFLTQKTTGIKDDKSTKKFLADYGRLVDEGDGKLWCRNPNSTLPPAWLRLYGDSYKERFALVNSIRARKLDADPLCNEHKVVNGNYNADLLVPVADTMSIFEGISSVEEMQAYHDMFDAAGKEYLRVCLEFANNPTAALWDEYCAKYKPVYMSLWLSYFWRMHMKLASSKLAHELGVTSFHYSAMLAHEQEIQMSDDEESKMHFEVVAIAEALRGSLSGEEEAELAHSGRVVKLSHKTVVGVATRADPRLVRLATSYRIAKKSDISQPPPLALVVELIVDALAAGSTNPKGGKPSIPHVDFFPGTPDMQRIIRQHIRSRSQNSDMHHIKVRGGWLLRRGLERVAKGCGMQVEDIFALETPDDIKALVQRYEECPVPASPMSPSGMSPSGSAASFTATTTTTAAAAPSGGLGVVHVLLAFAAGAVAGVLVQKKLASK